MSQSDPSPLIQNLPRYQNGDKPEQLVAQFDAHPALAITRGRLRHYPGLQGDAPATHCFYAAIASCLKSSDVVWDVGCGAGVGTVVLANEATARGFDRDSEAIDFATRLAPSLSFHTRLPEHIETAPNAMVLVDVLSFQAQPEQLLWQLRQLASQHTTLYLAEPKAHAGQTLSKPARTAFNEQQLQSLLTRTGWGEADWVPEDGTFIVGTCRPSDTSLGQAFQQASDLEQMGRHTEACKRLESALEAPLRINEQLELKLQIAELAIALGLGDKASQLYLDILRSQPSHARAGANLAQLALSAGSAEDAMRLAVESLQNEPTSLEAACAIALCAEAYSLRDAFHAWSLASALAPAEAEVASRFAQCASNLGEEQIALELIESLKERLDAPNVAVQLTLSWLLLESGRTRDAHLEAQLAEALSPDDAGVRELKQAIQQAMN